MTKLPSKLRFPSSRSTVVAAPEHPWISRGSTLNPSPGLLQSERRDTPEGCRDRATADILRAVSMSSATAKRQLEQSATSWTLRAVQLDRLNIATEDRDQANSGSAGAEPSALPSFHPLSKYSPKVAPAGGQSVSKKVAS
jgi:hypothetical protein